MRKTAISLGVVGVVFVIAAALLAFWITPTFIARLPGDSNTTRTYSGRVTTVLIPAVLQQGNLAAAIRHGLPETINRQVKVLQTSGNTALVKDTSTSTSSGTQLGVISSQYAVDRKSLEATASHPSDWSVTNAKGLTISWPIGAKKQNYTGWVNYTQTTTQLKYVRQEQHGGVNTYVYQATVPATPIKNPQVLANLPKALPFNVLQAASKVGLLSSSALASLSKLFPNGLQIPLGYTYEATSTYWVAPDTGIVVDVSRSQRQTAGVALPNGKIIPLLPAFADNFKATSSSVQAAATDAKNGSNAITTLGVAVPIIALVLGVVLIIVAVILWIRGRERGLPAAAEPPPTGARI
ncbi:MAG: porin PorA family protein [Micromonosporaceae bacterium]